MSLHILLFCAQLKLALECPAAAELRRQICGRSADDLLPQICG